MEYTFSIAHYKSKGIKTLKVEGVDLFLRLDKAILESKHYPFSWIVLSKYL
jgi:hypothetical protein